MHYLPTLRVFFGAGRYNDYRLQAGGVEFLPHDGGGWRALDDSDLQLHLRFNTAVGKWLREHDIAKILPRSSSPRRRVATSKAAPSLLHDGEL
jgi:hypothetical protein